MKIRLPKPLSAALLAAIACQPTMAGYFQTGAIFGTDPTQSIINASDIPVTSGRYAPSAKDGNTTLTIEDDGTIGNALYIREGVLCVKNNNVVIQGTNANGEGYLALSVAGKNSSMEIDGAVVTLKSSTEYSGACAMIGGMDGSGSLSLDNEAELSIEGGYSIFIGYSGYLDKEANDVGFINGHASTATTTGDVSKTEDRYVGTYVSAASGKYGAFGQGIVNVMNGSSLKTGDWGALYMASGVLNIGKDSTVISAQKTDARDINVGSIGHQDGCTSEINIFDGGSLLFNTGLVTGRGHNSRSTINVSGENSGTASKKSRE